ncbi:MAG: hypothetical protein HY675_05680 [Chloroflexi bacterium]|nr:hypothetical protein [Chloroflexota bacterium]
MSVTHDVKAFDIRERSTSVAPGSVKMLGARGFSVSDLEAILEDLKQYNATLPSDERIHGCLYQVNETDVMLLASELRRRLKCETNVLDALESVGLDPFSPDLASHEVPFPVQFVTPEDIQRLHHYPRRSSACFKGGTIFIGGELPGLRERLATLANRGILSNDLFHEVYHGFQGSERRFASLDEVLELIAHGHATEAEVALAESHAWLCSLRGFKDDVLIRVIKENYDIKNEALLVAAFEAINGLNALGYSDKEVGELIGTARWDASTQRYSPLDKVLEAAAADRGFDKEGLAAEVRKRKLLERIHAVKAMGIAAERCMSLLA